MSRPVIDRRRFLVAGAGLAAAGGAAATAGARAAVASAQDGSLENDRVRESVRTQRERKGGPIDEALVQDLVYWAHSDLEKVKGVVEREPRVVNAALDWGGGDFETALGAASHMGRRDIALYLLEHDARIDIFAAAMLGRLDVVKGFLESWPDLLHTPGPHGIPLITHAKQGGEEAKAVLAYLESLDAAR